MREILFRGKRADNGKWVEGELLHDMQNRPHLYWKTPKELPIVFSNHAIVDSATLGQFTGMTDKNGKKIFEGDILEYTSYTGTGIKEVFRAIVFWDEHRWSYKTIYNNRWTDNWNNKGYTCDVYKSTVSKYGEVIGNIHDKAELKEVNNG